MSVLALITTIDEAEGLVRWGATFAKARQPNLVVLGWTHSPAVHFPLLEETGDDPAAGRLAAEIERVVALIRGEDPADRVPLEEEAITIRSARHPDPVAAVLGRVRLDDIGVIVAAGSVPGEPGGGMRTDQLLHRAPCHVIVLYGGRERSQKAERVLAFAADGPYDRTTVAVAARMAKACGTKVTVATVEEDTGDEAEEVGRRSLRHILRDAQVKPSRLVRPQVLVANEPRPAVAEIAQKSDLIMLGANYRWAVPGLVEDTKKATVALIRQAPPLRPWRRHGARAWIPRLNPADYADLVQNLRQGSRWGPDFMMMLGMASAIASLGLLQSSTAVVIGSMLLAPLMTPMVGSGLALAQANPKLARTCFKSIFAGCMLTLAISFCLAIATPGEELTPEVVARGDPNILDLLIAACSGVAAAYALARPGLAGSIAGVAIAVALVPPLCSLGICLAYGQLTYAQGAGTLFVTNLVAIILAAAFTFRGMGVTASRAAPLQRRWVSRTTGALAVVAILLAIPLELALTRQVELGKPQPLGYPLPGSVTNSILDRVARDPGVEPMLMARPSRVDPDYDAVIYLVSEAPLPRSYGDEMAEIVRRETEDPDARVKVLCVQQGWQDEAVEGLREE